MKGSPSTGITGMQSGRGSDSERLGFDTGGYIVKKGTPQGEGAMFNKMPPGMDIDNQDIVDIRSMPFKKLVNTDYPGDGWGSSSDIAE